VFRTSSGAVSLVIGQPPRHRRLWPEAVDHVERRSASGRYCRSPPPSYFSDRAATTSGTWPGAPRSAAVPRTITTSSPLSRCTTSRGSVARLRALTVWPSLYRYRVPPVTTPTPGRHAGHPRASSCIASSYGQAPGARRPRPRTGCYPAHAHDLTLRQQSRQTARRQTPAGVPAGHLAGSADRESARGRRPVGRGRELAVLRDCLTAAEHRPGAVVLVCVAGIGKSWPAAELAHLDTCQPSTNRHLTSAYSAGLERLSVGGPTPVSSGS